jgi:very-short-patch-repair endonuclease
MVHPRKANSAHQRVQNTEVARMLRHEHTNAEETLWQHIRSRKIAGLKFRRQHPIDRFIVDFYCADIDLVIEVDGSIHDEPNADAERQEIIESQGVRVLRFTNQQVLEALEDVLNQIKHATEHPPE